MSNDRAARTDLGIFSLPVLVAALGYFVDVYDLVLIGMVGKKSLLAIGVLEADLTKAIGGLLGLQMIGMLVGGFAWGMIADRFGRVATLFGSILIYSTATLLNGFVTEMWQYEVLRVIAGFGLAGELGVGITLVVESLPRTKRAFAAALVASIGVAGAVLAWAINLWVDWSLAFIIGGLMGYALLILRWMAHESGMFKALDTAIPKGSLTLLFSSPARLGRYLLTLAIGLPTWFVIGIFAFLATGTAAKLGVSGPINGPNAIVFCYLGLILGDIAAGALTHVFASRRKTVLLFLSVSAVLCATVLSLRGISPALYYGLGFCLGLSVGFWALFVTIAAEQFGTNLRATVATTVPNVARGLFYPMQWALFAWHERFGYVTVVAAIGVICFGLALLAVWRMRETHGTDLDFVEEVA